MDFDEIKNKIFPPKKVVITYLLVREASNGIQTYVNPDVTMFNKAYKEQLISFLEGVIKLLKNENKKQKT